MSLSITPLQLATVQRLHQRRWFKLHWVLGKKPPLNQSEITPSYIRQQAVTQLGKSGLWGFLTYQGTRFTLWLKKAEQFCTLPLYALSHPKNAEILKTVADKSQHAGQLLQNTGQLLPTIQQRVQHWLQQLTQSVTSPLQRLSKAIQTAGGLQIYQTQAKLQGTEQLHQQVMQHLANKRDGEWFNTAFDNGQQALHRLSKLSQKAALGTTILSTYCGIQSLKHLNNSLLLWVGKPLKALLAFGNVKA